MAAGRLVVLVGPSGVGKGTVIAAAREADPRLWVSVSVTTRPRRPGETDGVAYHFVDDEEFTRLVAAGDLLEHAVYAGRSYGTLRAPVEAQLRRGVPSLLEIDLQGARQIRGALGERAHLVFLAPPSWTELEHRLEHRATEAAPEVSTRLATAREELAAIGEFDTVIVNDDVGSAARALVSLWGIQPEER